LCVGRFLALPIAYLPTCMQTNVPSFVPKWWKNGAPGRIRTHDPQSRSFEFRLFSSATVFPRNDFCPIKPGLENHSRKHTFDSIKELIHARQDKGWLIVFLGAGLAAAQQGTAMGIQAGSVANIGMDEQSLNNTMASVRCMLDDYAATPDLAEAKAYAARAAFSIKARAAMGDPSGGAGLVKPKGGKKFDPSTKARKQAPSLTKSPDDTWASSSGDAWET
jgi:hypothetical protein